MLSGHITERRSPDRRLEKVTCRLILFSIRFSWTLPLPISIDLPLKTYSKKDLGSETTRHNTGAVASNLRERRRGREKAVGFGGAGRARAVL
ncbi:hypothetical protein B296_00055946 [Ensete ventricosum]|uniref:Uncharacterized protein n=1 Tax=Ensete ventricosum TaxID=4639 RepID=A0A426XJS9_ENSVE|nr:hypothetical protein B296_00055946 [Ensete ventricosum]